jgi:hypothetical protein
MRPLTIPTVPWGTISWAAIPFLPVAFILSIGRSIVMNIAKIPVWPPEVEAECQIEADDPYRLDSPPPDNRPWYKRVQNLQNFFSGTPPEKNPQEPDPTNYGRPSEYD